MTYDDWKTREPQDSRQYEDDYGSDLEEDYQPEANEYLSKSMAWIAFSREVLKDSRPMDDWERATSADFFWSEFD